MTTPKSTSRPDFLSEDELAKEADEREWRTVSEDDVEETKFSFEQIGDQFTGKYLGSRKVERQESGYFTQYRFERDGTRYFINGTFNLSQGMATVKPGETCRITWTSERNTGQESDMRIYRVDVKRSLPGKRDNT